MTRSIVLGLLAMASVASLATLPVACNSGGIGDPCTPEDEYRVDFPGFKIQEENIESRSFQCQSRICLVNHFQGRVSCPAGQPPSSVVFCDPSSNTACDGVPGVGSKKATCVAAQTIAPECTSNNDCAAVPGLTCDKERKVCVCTTGAPTPEHFFCERQDEKDSKSPNVLKSYTCHVEGNCQNADADPADNKGKQCCVPGTDTPVGVPVCGQCEEKSFRDRTNAVYCSCRCLQEGEKGDPNFNYCTCPSSYSCKEIRPYVGLGDQQLSGSYCIKENSEFDPNKSTCGKVTGYVDVEACQGTTSATLGDGGT